MSGLSAHLVVEREAFALDLALEAQEGTVVALLGPNGAGKSTALQALAGLLPLTAGHVCLGGRVLDDPAADVLVPPARRGTGVVFQDYLLFPHLSALENVAFGLRATGTSRRAARAAAADWLDRLGVQELADRRPDRLSGGQAQRVALARALAPGPGLLLLDEPLSALDAGTRLEVRAELHRHLTAFAGCTVLVTHDPLDALVLADLVVVVEDGRVVQRGAPAEVARAPRTDYVARLVGLNLLRGTAAGTAVAVGDGHLTTASPHSGEVLVVFRPSAVVLHRAEPVGSSARNTWSGTVAGMEQHGDTVRVQVRGPYDVLADVTTAAVADLQLTAGAPVWCSLKATDLSCHPA